VGGRVIAVAAQCPLNVVAVQAQLAGQRGDDELVAVIGMKSGYVGVCTHTPIVTGAHRG
jgi:hypothetical protein